MSLLLQSMRSNLKPKDQMMSNTQLLGFPTGFTIFDSMNSSIERFADGSSIINGGMFSNFISFVGKSQSGKTSLSVKLGAGICNNYRNATFFFRDVECTTTESRFFSLTGWDIDTFRAKCDYKNVGINHDSIYTEIVQIAQYKENLKEKISINTGLKDVFNNPIMVFPPTVYLVDSLARLNPVNDDLIDDKKEVFNVGELKANQRTEGMVGAGSTKQLINKIGDIIVKYNIIVILINHITTEVATGFNKAAIPKQMQYLKQGEKLPGGAAYLYACMNIVRTDFVSRMEDDEFGPMINGSINKITLLKNKNNLSGVPVELVFDQRTGYNKLLSNWLYLYRRGYGFEGNPRSFKIKGSDISFTKKTLWEKAIQDFKENQGRKLVIPLNIATQRCLYYDFIINKPDVNPANWTTGNPTRYEPFAKR